MSDNQDLIPVKVSQISVAQISPQNMGFFVMLSGSEDERTLPIFIGATEAQAIAYHVNGIDVPRPLTHDLFKNVMEEFNFKVSKVIVSELKDDTFYARLFIHADGDDTELDSRPSDAIALALRFGAPIFVVREVMNSAGIIIPENKDGSDQSPAASSEEDAPLTPLEGLKKQLEKAISDERYEDAAKLRDEIKRMEEPGAAN
jgi:bifunctional DNase/RNase